jgi:ABC-type transport system involved in multi-copper enzyme maturation permease subunit
MKNAIRSEVRKILSTRSMWGLLLFGLLVVVASIIGMASDKASVYPARFDELAFLHFGATNVCLLMVIVGIRAMGDEFAYDTITPALTVDPDRRRLLGAKALTYGAAGALYTVVVVGILVPVALLIVHARHIHLVISTGSIAAAAVGSLAAAVLWAVIGVALGTIVRHRVPVLVGTLVWLAILETGFGGVLHESAKFLPGQLTAGLTGTAGTDPTPLGPVVAGVVMVALTLVLLVGGELSLRRDIVR